MSALHTFLFDGLPVRGALVQLTDAWTEVQRRRTGDAAWAVPVRQLVGEMAAAAVLLRSGIKFPGSLILQIQGDGPLKLAVAEVRPDLGLRATASVRGVLAPDADLHSMADLHGQGRCSVILDPGQRMPGQQLYQGVVALGSDEGASTGTLGAMLQRYMAQSEQLDTTLRLACSAQAACGLLVQRLPMQGSGNLAGSATPDDAAALEHYQRISMLASSLQDDELLTLDAQTILHRLFWNEPLRLFVPQAHDPVPHFSCSCSRDRVAAMVLGLGAQEAQSIVQERGAIDVGCEFCALQYHFDRVDVAQLFATGVAAAGGATLPAH